MWVLGKTGILSPSEIIIGSLSKERCLLRKGRGRLLPTAAEEDLGQHNGLVSQILLTPIKDFHSKS